MKYGKTVWAVYDTGWKKIRLSGENSLPLIFDTKEEAEEVATSASFFEVHECVLFKKNEYN